MSYVWSQEQADRFLSIFKDENTVTGGSFVSVEMETSREFARSVLPPCLDVPARPFIFIAVGLIRELFKGRYMQGNASRQEEEVGLIMVSGARNGQEGLYSLTEIVSGDFQIASGREFWGNPKKRGNAQLYNDGKTIYAWAERMGTRILEIEATIGLSSPEKIHTGSRSRYFTLKGDFAPDGSGLLSDPYLVTLNNGDDVIAGHTLENVRLTLRPNGSDPVETLDVHAIRTAALTYGGGSYRVEAVEKLTDRATYLPYLLGRMFDPVLKLSTEDPTSRVFCD